MQVGPPPARPARPARLTPRRADDGLPLDELGSGGGVYDQPQGRTCPILNTSAPVVGATELLRGRRAGRNTVPCLAALSLPSHVPSARRTVYTSPRLPGHGRMVVAVRGTRRELDG